MTDDRIRIDASAQRILKTVTEELANEVRRRAELLAAQRGLSVVGSGEVAQAFSELTQQWRSARRNALLEDVLRLYSGAFAVLGAIAGAIALIRVLKPTVDPTGATLITIFAFAVVGAGLTYAMATTSRIMRDRLALRRLDDISPRTRRDSTANFMESWIQLENRMRDAAGPELNRDVPVANEIDRLRDIGLFTQEQASIARRLMKLRDSIVHQGEVLSSVNAAQAAAEAEALGGVLQSRSGTKR